MRSDRTNYYGDVVLDSVNMAFRDEDSIIDQKYEKKKLLGLSFERFLQYKKIILPKIVSINPNFTSSLFKYAFSSITMNIKIPTISY